MYDPVSGEFVSFGDSVAVGYQNAEIIGDNVSDLFSGGPTRAQLAAQIHQDRQVDPRAVLVRQQQDTRRRYLDLPIPETVFTLGQTAIVTIKTQRVFRTEEVIVPDLIADNFVVTGITVGQNSQLAGAGAVPVGAYSSKAFRPRGVLWDTANPGIDIHLTVTAIAAGTLRGTLRGTTTVR